jgi:hypothetical protein
MYLYLNKHTYMQVNGWKVAGYIHACMHTYIHTHIQVKGAEGVKLLQEKIRTGGVGVLFEGSAATLGRCVCVCMYACVCMCVCMYV